MASNNQPSMISGHAQYAKGYAEETIGNVTGSKEWQESGKKDAQAGIDEMKSANQNRTGEPTPTGLGGKVEELAGKAAGCEGMEKEGLERQSAPAKGSEGMGKEGLERQSAPAK